MAHSQSQTNDRKPHGLIDRLVEKVKHAHDEHVEREHLRHEHQIEDVQHLAEHNDEMDRKNMPF